MMNKLTIFTKPLAIMMVMDQCFCIESPYGMRNSTYVDSAGLLLYPHTNVNKIWFIPYSLVCKRMHRYVRVHYSMYPHKGACTNK